MMSFISSPLITRVIAALPTGLDVYLVGGAVRDAMLARDSNDLDFVLAGDTLNIARSLADKLGGAYFPLDATREYARIVVESGTPGERVKLDFATFQGGSLESDLRMRDFTINAMAVNLNQPGKLIDPLGGAVDLAAKKLRACSPEAMLNDPVRILRAVRLARKYEFMILPETVHWMRQAVGRLGLVSPERLRDELFHILDCDQPRAGLEILDRIGALEKLLPEVVGLKGVEQSAPHIYDVWTHTLEVVNRLSAVLATLAGEYHPDRSSNLILGLVSIRLGRFRQALDEHLAEKLNPDRSLRALLFLAALYHDTGKPSTRTVDDHDRVRFLGHDHTGETLAIGRAQALHLSNLEVERLGAIVHHHMRPFLMSQMDGMPTRRAIYRFFRDTGAAGVDICVLSMADMLATYGPTLAQEDWSHHLDVVRSLLSAWWEHPQEQVAPAPLVNGTELMHVFGLRPGPEIGRLLEAIREAQATGDVSSREQALDLARGLVDQG